MAMVHVNGEFLIVSNGACMPFRFSNVRDTRVIFNYYIVLLYLGIIMPPLRESHAWDFYKYNSETPFINID